MFNERVASLILGIPLRFIHQPDRWWWGFDKHGHYIVRSAYDHITHSTLHVGGDVDLWKKVWAIGH